MKPEPRSYLRAYRLRWGLTQSELAFLLGFRSGSVVSRVERDNRSAPLPVAIAYQVLFGKPQLELFPGLYSNIEAAVLHRVHELHERLQGDPSRKARSKINFLEAVIARLQR